MRALLIAAGALMALPVAASAANCFDHCDTSGNNYVAISESQSDGKPVCAFRMEKDSSECTWVVERIDQANEANRREELRREYEERLNNPHPRPEPVRPDGTGG